MKKVILEVFGAFMFLIGFTLMIANFSGTTGYAIIDNLNKESSATISLALLIGGMIMFIAGRYIKETPIKISVDNKKGMRKIKLAKATKTISYKRLKKIAKEAGYKVVETNEYTSVFSPRDEIIKDENGYPIIIKEENRNNKSILLKMLDGIIANNKN